MRKSLKKKSQPKIIKNNKNAFQKNDITQVDDNYNNSSGLEDKFQENCKQSGSESMAKITKKVLLCAVSHGKELVILVSILYQSKKNHEAIGFGKPGGHAKDILIKHNFEGEQLRKQDVGGLLVLICGTNDVVCNKAQKGISNIKTP